MTPCREVPTQRGRLRTTRFAAQLATRFSTLYSFELRRLVRALAGALGCTHTGVDSSRRSGASLPSHSRRRGRRCVVVTALNDDGVNRKQQEAQNRRRHQPMMLHLSLCV